MSNINDNKKFWKNVKPIFDNRNKGTKTIAMKKEMKLSLMMKNLLKLLMNIL